MLQSVLAAQIATIPLSMTESVCAVAWVDAWITYFGTSNAGPVPCVAPVLQTAPRAAMLGALTGMSAPSAGAGCLQAGILAFWGSVAALATTVYPTAITVTPPPGLAGLAAALTPVFAANTSGNLSKVDAANTIATALHLLNLGGTAIIISPPPVPIT